MFLYGVLISVTILNILPYFSCMPFIFDDDDDFELKDKHRNRERPCKRNENARTFFPVQFSYIDVNYNYNCGADSISSINRPIHHKPHHQHNKPAQSQDNKPVDVTHDPVEDHTVFHQQQSQKPLKPFMTFVQNHAQGMGILHTIVNGIFSATTQKPSSMVIPVHEVQEDPVLEEATKWKPGQYVAAYNPFTGQHTLDVSQFNSKRLYRKISRNLDWFLKPIYDLL